MISLNSEFKTKIKKSVAILMMVCLMFTTFGCLNQTYLPSSDDAVVQYPSVNGYAYAPENPYRMDSPQDDYGRFQNGLYATVSFENNGFDTSMNNDNFRINIGYTPEGSDVTVNVNIGDKLTKTVTLSDSDPLFNSLSSLNVNTGYSLDYFDDDNDGSVEVTIEHPGSQDSVKINEVAYIVDQTEPTTSDSTTDTTDTTSGTTGGTSDSTSPSTGTVEFYTDPVGANVYVDGEYKGQTSSYSYGVLNMELYEGTHSYEVSAQGYNTETGSFSVTAGDTNAVSVSLDEKTTDDTSSSDGSTDDGGSSDGSDDGSTDDSTNSAPYAQISASQTSQTNIVFTSKSSDPDGEVVKQEWFLNGDSVSTGEEYQLDTEQLNTGSYIVELKVTDDKGATSTAKYQVTIDKEKKVVETKSDGSSSNQNTDSGSGTSGTVLKIPGFEAVFAIAGLIIVVLLARRDET